MTGLAREPWRAAFIHPSAELKGAPRLRREFELASGHGKVVSAQIALSALGVHETWINGERIGADLLEPGWTSYERRILFRTYDVSTRIRDHNVIGMILGHGWYAGYLGWSGERRVYGDELAAFAELRIEFEDRHVQIVGTDDAWVSAGSEILADDLYRGQEVDARLRDRSWLTVGRFGDWRPVRIADTSTDLLQIATAPPVREIEVRPMLEVHRRGARTLLDVHQNVVGWVRLRARGPRGSTITVRHAEVLDGEGLATRPLRGAHATDTFILSGDDDLFEPTFTFHGFRYAEVLADAKIEWSAEAVVIGSDLRRTGWFECSDPDVNRLYANVVWSTRGNFLSIPSDCPQRDERLGWTGDIAVFAPTAAFLFDTSEFLSSWCRDLALEQTEGVTPFVVPDPLKYGPPPMGFARPPLTAIWSDAAVWVPYALWRAYGSTHIVAQQFLSMAEHVSAIESRLTVDGRWDDGGFQFGDWLDPSAPADRPGEARAHPAVVATACAYRTIAMFAELAEAVGEERTARSSRDLATRVREGFVATYVESDGRILSDAQSVYALAIVFGLVSGSEREAAGRRLAELVAADGYRIGTGFAGTPFICDALSATGHHADAMRLLLQKECPSWLYPVTMGATTIWERWDSMLPDGTVNPGEMTSFNHYALGSVADWLHRRVAGLSSGGPGYSSIVFSPGPAAGITSASAALETPHGRAEISWRQEGDLLHIDLVLPDGIPGQLVSPTDGSRLELGPGRTSHTIDVSDRTGAHERAGLKIGVPDEEVHDVWTT